ncbi:E3 Ubiquitin ligase family protein [Striga asiatica]|uniref:RING-type E3 ubiquitin transferase n=1 Tax=Striga asiatica TaxID=4170 RepID=A0A5A7R7S0_STRAF|nr:E3 Ubiquitin ligase family protein [Striga asiatica]
MSMVDRVTEAIVGQLVMAADGAMLGLGIAYAAYCSFRKYSATSSALRKIRQAPAVEPSDIRSVLADGDGSGGYDESDSSVSCSDGGKLVIVRGTVEVKSALEKGNWKSIRGSNLVVSRETGDQGVLLERVHTCVYHELRGIFRWPHDIRSLLSNSLKPRGSSSVRMVPFILVEGGKQPHHSDYLVVNMEGSKHPLPLVTVFRDVQPLSSSTYTFLQALLGLEYPVGLLYEEKILSLGKDITAVGVCNLKDGIPEIKSCEDLPYFLNSIVKVLKLQDHLCLHNNGQLFLFNSCDVVSLKPSVLSDLNKDQMVAELSTKSNVLMWSGLVLGSVAIGIFSYCIARNWVKWKARRSRQVDNSADIPSDAEVAALDEESGEVPEGQLCVVCLLRIRHSAFIPCGHLVCCQRCALVVERESLPKCPVCRQQIRSSVRIYDS